jgi:hypothetical protein
MAVQPGYTFTRGTGRLICGVFAFVLFVIVAFVLLVSDHGVGIDFPLGILSAGLAFLALAIAI